jgi:hypothetical protein
MDPDVHSGILNFRAFLLSRGIDVDYTTAINLLTGEGFEQLRESGFSTGMMERLGDKIPLDDAAKRDLPGDWTEWVRSRGQKTAADESHRIHPRTDKSAPVAKGKLGPVRGSCVKCHASRSMRDAHEVTTKSGKIGIQGTCPVCGHGMFRFGRLKSARTTS